MEDQMELEPEVITLNELARRLERTPATIHVWIDRRMLPASKIGGSLYFYWPHIRDRVASKLDFTPEWWLSE